MSQTKAKRPEPLVSHQSNHASESDSPVANDPAPQETPHGIHERAHAAHLNDHTAKPHTRPAGDLRQGAHPCGRRQP